jgi:hypothetical protein
VIAYLPNVNKRRELCKKTKAGCSGSQLKKEDDLILTTSQPHCGAHLAVGFLHQRMKFQDVPTIGTLTYRVYRLSFSTSDGSFCVGLGADSKTLVDPSDVERSSTRIAGLHPFTYLEYTDDLGIRLSCYEPV